MSGVGLPLQALAILLIPEIPPALSRTKTPLGCPIRQNILQKSVDDSFARAQACRHALFVYTTPAPEDMAFLK